jgi:hypothetical protein
VVGEYDFLAPWPSLGFFWTGGSLLVRHLTQTFTV